MQNNFIPMVTPIKHKHHEDYEYDFNEKSREKERKQSRKWKQNQRNELFTNMGEDLDDNEYEGDDYEETTI